MQENLYREVKRDMEAAGGALLTPDLLAKKKSPNLSIHCCKRNTL
jgi:hypothetical protein